MLSFIKGTVESVESDSFEIESNSIGYKIFASLQTISALESGSHAKVFTQMIVRENDIFLVGFINRAEQNLFKLLTSVSGVGPKSALSILSVDSYGSIANSIVQGDTAMISKASGIGKKTAERIIIDLRDRLSKMGDFDHIYNPAAKSIGKSSIQILKNDNLKEAFEALVVLGYSKKEVDEVFKRVETSGKSTQEIIKMALTMVSY